MKGEPAVRAMRAAQKRAPKSHTSGKKSFTFDSGIYGHKTVKDVLLDAQHGKCAFCESRVAHISYGDVEHFRPKSGWRQEEKDPLERPGYYWLAYEWTNLFIACTRCNQQFKQSLFPLRTPKNRARNHSGDVTAEEPLLIDPAADDPESFISFRQEVPYAIAGSERGEATIRIMGLLRDPLVEQRRKQLDRVRAFRDLVAIGVEPYATEARNKLDEMKQDSEEYASMTRAFLR